MKKILASLMTAAMLVPSAVLASGPKRPAPPVVRTFNIDAWCEPETDFDEKCKVGVDTDGFRGPEGHIVNVTQWGASGEPFDKAAGIAGAVVGGAVGTGGLMACAVAAGPAAPGCIVLFPFLSLLGAGVGGNAGAKPVYFIVVGDDVNGKEIRQDFKMTVWRSGSGMAKKMSKKLRKFTGLKQGEQKV